MLYCFPIYKVIKAKLSNAHLFRYLACHVTPVRFSFLYTVGRLKSSAWKMQIGHTCIAPLERVPRTHARTVISTRRRATVHGARKTRLFVWPLRTRITGEIEECKREWERGSEEDGEWGCFVAPSTRRCASMSYGDEGERAVAIFGDAGVQGRFIIETSTFLASFRYAPAAATTARIAVLNCPDGFCPTLSDFPLIFFSLILCHNIHTEYLFNGLFLTDVSYSNICTNMKNDPTIAILDAILVNNFV